MRLSRLCPVVALIFSVAVALPSLAETRTAPMGRVDSVDVLRRAHRSTVELFARTETRRRMTAESSGAGVVVSADGYVVTALHVIRDFPELEIKTCDGVRAPATLIVAEPDLDIALLKVETPRPLEAATPASNRRITEGRRAMVVGNPLGQGQTAIRGKLGEMRIVSWDGNRAPLRSIEAEVVPGNSGGGAFDVETGELLGITVAKSSTLDHTGYIVPADQISQLFRSRWPVAEWSDVGEVHEIVGATLRPVRLTGGRFEQGLLVTHVEPASLAERAGWSTGDVVVGLGSYQTKNVEDVLYVLHQDPQAVLGPLPFVVARDQARAVGTLALAPFPVIPGSLDVAAVRSRSTR